MLKLIFKGSYNSKSKDLNITIRINFLIIKGSSKEVVK